MARDIAESATEEAPVYDIMNAGPRRRFTVEGKLVSNCYGLTGVGLLDLMAVTYATAEVTMPEWLTREWCDQFIIQWFGLYPDVEPYMEEQYYRVRRYGMAWDPLGRIRLAPEIRSVHKRIRNAGLRQAGNMPVQSFSAGLMKLGMSETNERVIEKQRENRHHCEALLTVHDELVTECEEDKAEQVLKGTLDIFGNVDRNQLRVRIEADGKVGKRWEK